MELGISGRKALVCASSKGLGKACATALAEAGCEVFVNGRDAAALRETAGEIRRKAGVTVIEVVADLMTEAGRAAVIEACPDPDILVNNNSGPPSRDFRSLDHAALLAGIEANMLVPIALIQACRSEETTSELPSLKRISYAVFCLKKKKKKKTNNLTALKEQHHTSKKN